MKAIKGGILAAKGFEVAACAAGIKYKDRDDMALIFSQRPCETAGTFTTNVVKAAPVVWDRDQVYSGKPAHAVVINAGIANACTGQEGMDYCARTARAASEAFGGVIPADSVLVASTGVIGMQLPMEKLENGIAMMVPELSGSEAADERASRAIMTTDTKNKQFAVEFEVGGVPVRMGGMCKGSGMIHPNMCTMLCFITTDCAISKELLQKALSEDIKDTFNMVSVDGDTSTNDTVLLLANGAAGNPVIEREGEDFDAFCRALHAINETLAKKIAEDGEGATHLFEVKVVFAASKEEAVTIAKSVVGSSLTKAAIYGRDANWGRILCAMGYSGAQFDPAKVRLYFVNDLGKICVYKDGVPQAFDEDCAKELLGHSEVTALIEMHEGEAQATAWGCDLTHGYVDINADYRS